MRSFNSAPSLTIEGKYAKLGSFTSGFDYLRIGLAIAVILMHSIIITGGRGTLSDLWSGWSRIPFSAILPMFFALSGFLVAGSLKRRPSATSFVTLRGLRLVPALAVEILLSALILGPLLTTLSLGDYFTSKGFIVYFLNITGNIHLTLPGVFEHNIYPKTVNGSLWTIPYELECYLLLIAAYVLGVVERRALFAGLTIVCVVLGTLSLALHYDPALAMNRPVGRALVVAFLVGVLINLYSDKIVLSAPLFAACLALSCALLFDYRTIYLATVPVAYVTLYLGMLTPRKVWPLTSGDYSYGLYLFAYPIQQTFSLFGLDRHNWLLNSLLTIVAGLAYAAFSWWCVEEPILRRKRAITQRLEQIVDGLKATFRRRFARAS